MKVEMKVVIGLSMVVVLLLLGSAFIIGFSREQRGQIAHKEAFKFMVTIKQVTTLGRDGKLVYYANAYRYAVQGDTASLVLSDWVIAKPPFKALDPCLTSMEGPGLEIFIAPFRPNTECVIHAIQRIN